MYKTSVGSKRFVCFSSNRFFRAWVAIRGNPVEQTLVLANNITPDDRGCAYATAKYGIVLNAIDIDWIRRSVSNSSMFYENANTGKAQRARLRKDNVWSWRDA